MTVEQPLISVIVPAYNAEKYLAEALFSIINQNYAPMEIILVDDGSTDRTADVATSFGDQVCYFYKENGGPPSARNQGLRLAHGDFIAFLDADDLWCEKAIELQIRRFLEKPQAEIVIGQTQHVQLSESQDKIKLTPLLPPQLALGLGSALIRKSVFNNVGMFDESLFYCDDLDWFMRAREKGVKFFIHADITLLYRRHTQNITNQRQLSLKYIMRMFKKSIDRRRTDCDDSTQVLKNWSDFYENKD